MTTYAAGENINLTVNFYLGANLFDPYAVADVDIYNQAGTLQSSITPTRVSLGVYRANYTLPAAAAAGTWAHHWTYTAYVGMTPHEDIYNFTVATVSTAVVSAVTPIEHQIFDHVLTTLAGITTANGYNQTVVRVEKFRPLDEPDPASFPTLHAWIENKQRDSAVEMNKVWQVHTLVVRGFTRDGNDPALAINQLMADVERALMVDPHRGGYAIRTAPQGVEEPEVIMGDGFGGRAVAYAEFEIVFRTKAGDPYSQ
jgi:hypothetical protein